MAPIALAAVDCMDIRLIQVGGFTCFGLCTCVGLAKNWSAEVSSVERSVYYQPVKH